MKKITFLLTFLMFYLHNTNSYAVIHNKYTPYVGFDYIFNNIDIKEYTSKNNAANIRIGSDYNKYFSTEIFINQSDSYKKHKLNNFHKLSYKSYGLDVFTYLPLGCEQKFNILATAGIGEYIFNNKIKNQKHKKEHGLGYRFGAGLKYKINKTWQIRYITRYIKFDKTDTQKYSIEQNIGIEYHFNNLGK